MSPRGHSGARYQKALNRLMSPRGHSGARYQKALNRLLEAVDLDDTNYRRDQLWAYIYYAYPEDVQSPGHWRLLVRSPEQERERVLDWIKTEGFCHIELSDFAEREQLPLLWLVQEAQRNATPVP